jgi:hypothetical protein
MASNPPEDYETGQDDAPGGNETNPSGVSTTEPAEGSDDTPGGGVQSPGHSERDIPANPD